jgi:6-phosphogluconolactonase (cycloisomerase 2 family)
MVNFNKNKFYMLLISSIMISQNSYANGSDDFSGHHVYVNSNDAANKVIHYAQKKDGELVEISRLPTNGKGTAGYKKLTDQVSAPDALASSGALTLSKDHKLLFVVNTADNSVSSFSIQKDGQLKFIDVEATGESGNANTLSYNDKLNILYVGHSFGPDHIKAFKVSNGRLKLLKVSQTVNTPEAHDRVLSQIQVDPTNKFLLANVVFEKRPQKVNGKLQAFPSNTDIKDGLAVYPIQHDGNLGKPRFFDAGGPAPFGLRFMSERKGDFVNTLDSSPGLAVFNHIDENGNVQILSSAQSPAGEADENGKVGTCWVSYSVDGKVAYVSAFDIGEVISFRINGNNITTGKGKQGLLEKTDLSNDMHAIASGSPIGNWSSPNGYFYQLYPSAAKLIGYKMSGDELIRVGDNAIPLNSTQGIDGF